MMTDRTCFYCPRPYRWILRLSDGRTVYRSCGMHLSSIAQQATHWGPAVTIERAVPPPPTLDLEIPPGWTY